MKGSWVRELLEACGGLRDGSVAGRSCTEPRPVQVKPLSPTVGRQTATAAAAAAGGGSCSGSRLQRDGT